MRLGEAVWLGLAAVSWGTVIVVGVASDHSLRDNLLLVLGFMCGATALATVLLVRARRAGGIPRQPR